MSEIQQPSLHQNSAQSNKGSEPDAENKGRPPGRSAPVRRFSNIIKTNKEAKRDEYNPENVSQPSKSLERIEQMKEKINKLHYSLKSPCNPVYEQRLKVNFEEQSNKSSLIIRNEDSESPTPRSKLQFRRSAANRTLAISSNVISVAFGSKQDQKSLCLLKSGVFFSKAGKDDLSKPDLLKTIRSEDKWVSSIPSTNHNLYASQGVSPERVPGKFRCRSIPRATTAPRVQQKKIPSKKIVPTVGADLRLISFQINPQVDHTNQQLKQIAQEAIRIFGLPKMEMEVKKYRNCVCFSLQYYQIVWYYEGSFYLGELCLADGASEKNGFGIEIQPEKFIYEGSFKKGSKEGLGRIRYSNGDYYDGQWLHGIRNGEGVLITKDKDRYEGMFLNGMRQGHGKQSFSNRDTYVGNYRKNKFDGEGFYKWANGSIYKGGFVEGLRSGFGEWRSKVNPPFDQYSGQYLEGKKNGKGVYKWENGSSYEGEFLNDLKHGQGIMRFPNGKATRAIWEAGMSKKKLYCEEQERYKESKKNMTLTMKPSPQHEETPLPYPNPPPRQRSFSKQLEQCSDVHTY